MANSAIIFDPSEVSRYYAARVPQLNQRRAAEWRGPCPVHDGTDDNFAVDSATGQAYCHSQCGRGWDILGLEQALTGTDPKTAKTEVFRLVGRRAPASGTPRKSTGAAGKLREIASYPYEDRDGSVVYETVRFQNPDGDKTFKFRRSDGRGGYIWNLNGIERVPYRLPRVLKAETVYLPEGEKDVHTLEEWGLVASCNPEGSGQSKLYAQWTDIFAGKQVVILVDNDDPGRKHAVEKAEILLDVAASVRILEFPALAVGGDVTDWKDAGGTLEGLLDLCGRQTPLDATTLAALRAKWSVKPRGGTQSTQAQQPSRRSFQVTDEGVFAVTESGTAKRQSTRLSARLDVVAATRDDQGNNWGRLLRWKDADGRRHQWAMPMDSLASDACSVRARLLSEGLPFIGLGFGLRDLFTEYLQTAPVNDRARCVTRVGWHGNTFVLPDKAIGGGGDQEEVLYQTPYEAAHFWNSRGTPEEWRENVGKRCSGNSRLVLAASCGVAGPTLNMAGAEPGGVHFCGESSTGKTTALVVGGSVCGGGGNTGFVQSWRTTVNGLEAVAEAHNDGTLFLDELSQVDPSKLRKLPTFWAMAKVKRV